MTTPTEGETFSQLIEYLRKGQESCATLSHITGLNDRAVASRGWLLISEQLKAMQRTVIAIATGKLQ